MGDEFDEEGLLRRKDLPAIQTSPGDDSRKETREDSEVHLGATNATAAYRPCIERYWRCVLDDEKPREVHNRRAYLAAMLQPWPNNSV